MTLKELKENFTGQIKTYDNKRVFYAIPHDLFNHISKEDWHKIGFWNGICILPSKTNIHKCFYCYWGYGASPKNVVEITLNKEVRDYEL